MTKEEMEWRKKNDAYEQLDIVLNWCDYEDYDYLCRCGTMERLIELYIFINFDIGVEFVSGVQKLIDEELDEGNTETLDKALAWDMAHDTRFWHDLTINTNEL